jgi:hypothetical protein
MLPASTRSSNPFVAVKPIHKSASSVSPFTTTPSSQHPNRSRWCGPVLALQVRLLAWAGDNLCRGFGGFSCADHPGSLSLPHTISATTRPALGDRELVETPPKTRLLPARHVVCALSFLRKAQSLILFVSPGGQGPLATQLQAPLF